MGIYIHIPFCKQKCTYCDFHFSTSLKNKDDLIAALLVEIELQKHYLNNMVVESIYFGGGTPSFLETKDLKKILDKVYATFEVSPNSEISIEGNPDDFTFEKLQSIKRIGINRLSIGIQSFNDQDLAWMNRAHNSQQAITCVEDAQRLGFNNITIDLIYGLPDMTSSAWEANLNQAINLNVQHISAYNLTVEEGTALHYFVKKGKTKPPNDEVCAEQFENLIDTLEQNGFVQYEISNFGKEGYFSKHNSSYWSGKHYLGIGPSAHSFNGKTRQWNVANNAKYIKSLKENKVPFEIEQLTLENRFNEYILLGLRTIWGCDLNYIKSEFGNAILADLNEKLVAFREHFTFSGSEIVLNKKGRAFADKIASELFI